jgi:hypothetical protein
MWAELPTYVWANLPMVVRDGSFIEKKGRGAGAARGGRKASTATAPTPPTKTCVPHTETGKIGAVSKTTWCFGPEDLVKTKFINIYC